MLSPSAAQSPAPQPAAPPAKVVESITVTETISAESPANVTSLSREAVQQLPGVNVDDRLRIVPGFSLFRRSSSLVANPTTQGVSLRGIGSTGASRTLVLWDGIPVNDPFGGWVYWTRLPAEELDRVEVSRGASTSLFGDRALGGVVALFTRQPERFRLGGSMEGGNQSTVVAGANASHTWRGWGLSSRVRAATTGGYYIVPRTIRGSVDTTADVDFTAGDVRLDRIGPRDRAFLRLDILAERRDNGTVVQENSTSLGTISGQYNRDAAGGQLSLVGYHTREQFHASFSAVAANRNSERLTSRQTVPSTAWGGALLWQNRRVTLGADTQRVEGTSTDLLPTGAARVGGGSQLQHGYFAQWNPRVGALQFFFGARQQVTGQDQSLFAPSAGLAYARRSWRVRGSVYRSYRAPTLNELFREFRAGNAVTQANPSLRPERLFGAEAGLDWTGERTRFGVTVFRNELSGLITNVTLSVRPNEITRQRQNAEQALSRGIEADLRHDFGTWAGLRWQGYAGYLFAQGQLGAGFLIPQVPRHQGSLLLTLTGGRTTITGGVRAIGKQFEDDRNQFLLPGFAAVQFTGRQRLHARLFATLAVENALDRQFLTGFSPNPTIGAPRLVRVGLAWN